MCAILTWAVHDLKRRLDLKDTDFIIHDSVYLCPIKLDCATRELMESEILEWKTVHVYPAVNILYKRCE